MSKKKRMKTRQQATKSELSEFLSQLAQKLNDDQLVIKMGDRDITMDVPESFTMDVDVVEKFKKNKGATHRIRIDLRWSETEAEPALSLG